MYISYNHKICKNKIPYVILSWIMFRNQGPSMKNSNDSETTLLQTQYVGSE